MRSLHCTISVVAAAAFLVAGCIHHAETVYEDVPRAKVEFENDAAARLFYETLSQKSSAKSGRTESTTKVSIPVVFDHERRVVRGENHDFNEAVRNCDTNGDARITEAEARIFSERK